MLMHQALTVTYTTLLESGAESFREGLVRLVEQGTFCSRRGIVLWYV